MCTRPGVWSFVRCRVQYLVQILSATLVLSTFFTSVVFRLFGGKIFVERERLTASVQALSALVVCVPRLRLLNHTYREELTATSSCTFSSKYR